VHVGESNEEERRDRSWELASRYDAEYYRTGLGEPYTWSNPAWTRFFGSVAEYIVEQFAPKTALDAGCGLGFLVGALRERGVDAQGFDVSEYAIAQVPDHLRPFCRLGSVTEAIDGRFDLITCIEVLEHLPSDLAQQALDNLTRHSDLIVFSSTPDDIAEETHLNVRSPDQWVRDFAARGFLPRPDAGIEVLAPHAIALQRGACSSGDLAARYEVLRWKLNRELAAERRALAEQGRVAEAQVQELSDRSRRALAEQGRVAEAQMQELSDRSRDLEAQLAVVEAGLAEWSAVQARSGWRLFVAAAGLRRRLGPPGTARDAGIRQILRAAAEAADTAHLMLERRAFASPRAFKRLLAERRLAEARVLALRTRETLRSEGPLEVARRARQRLGNGPAVEPRLITQGLHSAGIETRYAQWRQRRDPSARQLARQRAHRFDFRPLISIVVPVFDPPTDVLQELIDSVLAQTYGHFELCFANAGASLECDALLQRAASADGRIRVAAIAENRGISANSNAALDLASGEYVALLDHDDLLARHALYAVVDALNGDPELDVLYSDEDRLAPDGRRVLPYLKPEWSPEFLHSYMWTGHLTVYRRTLVESLGGFRSEYDGSQDYDLMLRAAAVTDRIRHVPGVLYHWRMIAGSAAAGGKFDARRTNLAALGDAISRSGRKARIAEYPFANRVMFAIAGRPLVSIVIPTDEPQNARGCIKGILARTTYDRYEIVVVTNSPLAGDLEEEFGTSGVRTVAYDGHFNFSLKCNLGAEAANGEYLLFLNDDVEPLSAGWVESMLQSAQLPEIGGVSGKLLYADDTIQYAGLVTGVRDLVGTAFHTWQRTDGSYHSMALCVRNTSCLTGACLLMRATEFHRVGGWDAANTPISHSDFDLSYRLTDAGLRLVYTPFAELRHFGHVSRRNAVPDVRLPTTRADRGADTYLLRRWGMQAAADPYYTQDMRDLLDESGPDEYVIVAPTPAPLSTEWWDQPRALLIAHELSLTGAPLMLVEVAKALQREGMLVVISTATGGPLVATCIAEGIPVVIDGEILRDPARSERFMRGFDIVGANTVLSWRAIDLAVSLGKPAVWLVQEPRFGLAEIERGGSEARAAFERATRVVFPSRNTSMLYRQFGDAARHLAVHYGIPDVSLEARPTPAFETEAGVRSIACVGSIESRKGADVLVEALTLLPEESRRQVRLLLVGRELTPEFVADILRRADGVVAVDIVGERPRDETLAYMRDADLVVSASRDESGPLVVIEAMALGKAVISTNVGAAAEIITSGVDGEIVEVGDVGGLRDILARVLSDDAFRASLGQAARATYLRHLTEERYGDELVTVFREALSETDAQYARSTDAEKGSIH
jgi:O-antigen biosynthesis protein